MTGSRSCAGLLLALSAMATTGATQPASDPFGWLEADPAESQVVSAWAEQRNFRSRQYFDEVAARSGIKERLESIWSYERFDAPQRFGDFYYYFGNRGLDDHFVLYREAVDGVGPDQKRQVVLDPNEWQLPQQEHPVDLSGVAVSPNGKRLAWSIRDATGAVLWDIRDLDAAVPPSYDMSWLKAAEIAWAPDSQGFFYSRPTADEEGAGPALYFHRIGSKPDEDRLVYTLADQSFASLTAVVTSGGEHLLVHGTDISGRSIPLAWSSLPGSGTGNSVFEFQPLPSLSRQAFSYIGNQGKRFYYFRWQVVNSGPELRSVVSIDARAEDPVWLEHITPTGQLPELAVVAGGKLIVASQWEARSTLTIHDLEGDLLRPVELPGPGRVTALTRASRVNGHDEAFFVFSSLISPEQVFRLELPDSSDTLSRPNTPATSVAPFTVFAGTEFPPSAGPASDRRKYVLRKRLVESADGTAVPVLIAAPEDLVLDGSHPLLLEGYGGFGIPAYSGYSIARMAWLEMGGLYAVAGVRGGAEYGAEWHRAGIRSRRQNALDDFIASAEFLLSEGYTDRDRLAIMGASNGGLLVSAVSLQRPELFRAVVAMAPLTDMLRYHRLGGGQSWIEEYGLSEYPGEAAWLAAYSPYHNIRDGVRYPATLITTAINDQVVAPAHSFKYSAALARAKPGSPTVLLRLHSGSDHGQGRTVTELIDEYSDIWTFLYDQLQMSSHGAP